MRYQSLTATASCVVAVFLGSAGLLAQAPSSAPNAPTVAADAALGLSMRAYQRLFKDATARAGRSKAKAPAFRLEPETTCGIRVVPPDPTIDPKFETPLHDTRTRFMIRTVPTFCR